MNPATRDVLHVLARRLGDRPVFLIATARTPELLEASTPAFPGMSIVVWNSQDRLAPLDSESTRQLASALSPKVAAETRVLHRIELIADGNPHFTEMLVADWERYATASLAGGQSLDAIPDHWQPPDSLRQAFAQTYAGVGKAAQEILHVLAVAGRALGMYEVSELVPTQGAEGATVDLLQRGILRLAEGELSFKNELHRAFVYFAIAGDLRRFFHSRLGRTLLARDQANYMTRLEAGRHLHKAGLPGEATRAVLSGARLAIDNGAPAEAESAIQMVIGNCHDPEGRCLLDLLLVESRSAQGHYAESLELLETLREELLSPDARALIAFLRAQALQRVRLTDDDTIRTAAEHAICVAESLGADRLIAASAQVVAEAAFEMGISELLAQAIETTQRLERRSSNPATRGQALLTTGFCHFNFGRFAEALSTLEESGKLLRAARLDSEMTRALNGQALCLMSLGRHGEALTCLATAVRATIKLNDAPHRSTILTNMGVAYEEVGTFAEAELCHRNAVKCNPPGKNPRVAVTSHVNIVQSALIRGDFDDAMAGLADARDAATSSKSWRLSALVDFTQADVLLAIEEPEHAWPFVLRAATNTWGRERSLDTNGKAIRLTLHCALATAGVSKLRELLAEVAVNRPPMPIGQSLEVGGFLSWVARTSGLDENLARGSGFRTDLETLLGPIAILAAVGVTPREEWARQQGESALSMIERVFPYYQRRTVLPLLKDVLPELTSGGLL